jgi:GT2 family glycosyltransferase
MKSISIIIVSYRCWDKLGICLNSIEQQNSNALEVIVVDNFSNDGRGDAFIACHPKVKFVMQKNNGGFAQACNRGALEASGDYLLFLNPDTVLTTNILQPLLEKVEANPDWKLTAIKQLDEKGRDTYPFGLFVRWWNVWPPMRSLERFIKKAAYGKKELSARSVSFPEWLSGSFILIRSADFKILGGWDERFWMYSEDMDLSKRAYDMGWKRVLYNELQCVHTHGGSSRANPKVKAITKSAVIRSAYQYMLKHLRFPGKWIALGTHFLVNGIELILLFPFSSTKRNILLQLLKSKQH